MIRQLILLTSSIVLVACMDSEMKISGCDPVGDMQPVCEMQAPEDIAALPDGKHLLLSNFGGMAEGSRGKITVFNTQTMEKTLAFHVPMSDVRSRGNAWGDRACKRPERTEFSPHGTHLHQLDNRKWRYLVVNHGGRESIEMFDVINRGEEVALAWRGCVIAPEDTFINDVVGLANGDVIFTRMFHQPPGLAEQLKSMLGNTTGDIWRWNIETGARVLPGTEANQPNGLEISPDERYVFANMYMTGEVWKIDVDSGEVVATAAVSNADNSAWGTDGRLWVTRHEEGMMNLLSCMREQGMPCGAGFEVVAIDPETMESEVLFEHRGAPMGAATVAVPQAGRVYMGSFVGDRMMSVADFSATKE